MLLQLVDDRLLFVLGVPGVEETVEGIVLAEDVSARVVLQALGYELAVVVVVLDAFRDDTHVYAVHAVFHVMTFLGVVLVRVVRPVGRVGHVRR